MLKFAYTYSERRNVEKCDVVRRYIEKCAVSRKNNEKCTSKTVYLAAKK